MIYLFLNRQERSKGVPLGQSTPRPILGSNQSIVDNCIYFFNLSSKFVSIKL